MTQHIVTVTLDDDETSSHIEPDEERGIACADLVFPCDGVVAVEVKNVDTKKIVYTLPKEDERDGE